MPPRQVHQRSENGVRAEAAETPRSRRRDADHLTKQESIHSRRSAGAEHEKYSDRAAAVNERAVGKFESRVEIEEREDEEATSCLAEIKKP